MAETMDKHPAVVRVEWAAHQLQDKVDELESALRSGERIDLAPLDDEVKTTLRAAMAKLVELHAAADYFRERGPGTRPPGVGG